MIIRFAKYTALIFIITVFTLSISKSHSLEDSLPKYRKVYLGPGLGINYGGIGVQLNYMPVKALRFSAGYGTNLLDMAYSLGLNYRILADKRICPTASYYYGFNGYIKQDEKPEFNKTYYGSSLGAGVEVWNKRRTNFLHFQIIIPIRTMAFTNELAELNKISKDTQYKVFPILLSIGYHFGINK